MGVMLESSASLTPDQREFARRYLAKLRRLFEMHESLCAWARRVLGVWSPVLTSPSTRSTARQENALCVAHLGALKERALYIEMAKEVEQRCEAAKRCDAGWDCRPSTPLPAVATRRGERENVSSHVVSDMILHLLQHGE